MPDQGKNGGALATATSEMVSQLARSAAGELVKGQRPFGEVAKTVAAEAVQTLDKRGPELTEEAGIMNWRYAALGWLTWEVGKRVLKRKAKKTVRRAGARRVATGGAS